MIILDEQTYRQHSALNFSSAKYLLLSPLHFKAELERRFKQSAALAVGTMTHSAVLEDDETDVSDPDVRALILQDKTTVILKPEGMSFATKAGKQWRDQQLAIHPGATFLSSDERDQYSRCTESLKANKDVQYLLQKCDKREIGIVQDYAELQIKGKIDAYGKDEAGNFFIFDLKTSASCSPDYWSRQVFSRNYALQAVWYQNLLALELSLDYAPPFYWVVAEKSLAADVAIYQPPEEALEIGRAQMNHCIEAYKSCVASGKWPGYGKGIIQLEVPPWERKRWLKQ